MPKTQLPTLLQVRQLNGEQVICIFTSYQNSEYCRAVKPGWWSPELNSMAQDGRKPGAWCYPANAQIAARLAKVFGPVFEAEKVELPETFKTLAGEGAGTNRMRVWRDNHPTITDRVVDFNNGASILVTNADYSLRDVLRNVPTARAEYNVITKKFVGWRYAITQAGALRDAFEDQAPDEWKRAEIDPRIVFPVSTVEQAPAVLRSKLPLWPHQETAVRRAWPHKGYGFFMQMGTGKTLCTATLIVNKGFKKTLIVTVKAAVRSVWAEKLPEYAAEPLAILALDGKQSVKEKTRMARQFLVENSEAQSVIVVNHAMMIQPDFQEFALANVWDCVVVDESQFIQAAGSKTSLTMYRVGLRSEYKYALTGTPMKDGPKSIYGQFRFFAPEIFGTRFDAFCERYLELDEYKRIVKVLNGDELNRKIYSRAYRVKTSEVIELPDRIDEVLEFDLSREAQDFYNDMELKLAATLRGEHEFEVNNILTAMLRCQQVTSGWLEQDGTLFDIDQGKIELLEDLLEGVEPGEPFVIFAKFHKDIDRIRDLCKKLGREAGELSGRRSDLLEWQAGKMPILIVQLKSGGAGIDLTRSCYAAYYSMDFSSDDDEQSIFRVWRPGQKRPTFIYRLVARGTIDEKILRAIARKMSLQELLLQER